MSRSSRQIVTLPLLRGGLALPTALAAVVCGGSLLAIAATGAVALDGGEHLAAEVAAAGRQLDAPLDAPVHSSTRTSTRSNASGLPAAGALRDSGRQSPIRGTRREPTQAATASQFTVEVRRPLRRAPSGSAGGTGGTGSAGGTDRAPLLSPQVVDPEAPTVVVVQDPAPTPPDPAGEGVQPPPTPTADPTDQDGGPDGEVPVTSGTD